MCYIEPVTADKFSIQPVPQHWDSLSCCVLTRQGDIVVLCFENIAVPSDIWYAMQSNGSRLPITEFI